MLSTLRLVSSTIFSFVFGGVEHILILLSYLQHSPVVTTVYPMALWIRPRRRRRRRNPKLPLGVSAAYAFS